MFGNNKDDVDKALANAEDPQDNGGFISPKHPDPLGVPEPPAPGAIDTSDSSSAGDPSSATTPQFGQPFTPGSVLPPAQDSDDSDGSASSAGSASSDDAANSSQSSTVEPTSPAPAHSGPAGTDDLIDIKKQALQQLTPLVGHLDQTPEEQFKTTMMMIQAADDQSLIQKAYDAAQQITDDKAKAQALLDIVNEINYFTQHDKPAN